LDRIEALAEQLALPRIALGNSPEAAVLLDNSEVPVIKFTDPDPFQEFSYPNALAARRAAADYLALRSPSFHQNNSSGLTLL